MSKKSDLDKELFQLAKYRALQTSRYYLMFVLFLLSLYFIYLNYSFTPFYILFILGVFPGFASQLIHKKKDKNFTLSYLKYQMRYSNQKFLSFIYSFYLSQLLMIIWAIKCKTTTTMLYWIRYFPTILIISSLLIYTIGQYYYFLRFQYHLLMNEAEKM